MRGRKYEIHLLRHVLPAVRHGRQRQASDAASGREVPRRSGGERSGCSAVSGAALRLLRSFRRRLPIQLPLQQRQQRLPLALPRPCIRHCASVNY